MPLKKGSAAAKKHMAKVRAKNSLIKSPKQSGSSNIEMDKRFQAKAPGKRTTGKGKTKHSYYENRANRSDYGKMLGTDLFDTSIINDIDKLKKEYFRLAKKYHPDAGGTTEQFQKLQAEYEKLFKKLLNGSKLSEEEKSNETVLDNEIRAVIDQLINIEGIEIELIGKWLWISGNTYPVRGALKQAGLLFIKKGTKPYWVYKGVESKSRGKMEMEDIRKKYGSEKVELKQNKRIQGISPIQKVRLKRALMKIKKALDRRPI